MDNIYLPLARRSWAQRLENFTILHTVNAWKTYFNGLKFRGTNFREPALSKRKYSKYNFLESPILENTAV